MLATSRDPKRNSGAFVGGVALGIAIGLTVSYVTAQLANEGGGGNSSSGGSNIFKWVIVGLLLVATVIEFRGRHEVKTPKWMISLQQADPQGAFKLGLLLILLMPSDIIVMLSVGEYLSLNGLTLIDSLGFALLTVLIAALPALAYMIGGKRAEAALPKLREWMSTNSWMISIGVYIFFIYALAG
jgi:hypothetical protein